VRCVDEDYQVLWKIISVEIEDTMLTRTLRGVLMECSPNSQHRVVLIVATWVLNQAVVFCRNVDRRAQFEDARHDHIPYCNGEFVLLWIQMLDHLPCGFKRNRFSLRDRWWGGLRNLRYFTDWRMSENVSFRKSLN
jgi:hypothetical protein